MNVYLIEQVQYHEPPVWQEVAADLELAKMIAEANIDEHDWRFVEGWDEYDANGRQVHTLVFADSLLDQKTSLVMSCWNEGIEITEYELLDGKGHGPQVQAT